MYIDPDFETGQHAMCLVSTCVHPRSFLSDCFVFGYLNYVLYSINDVCSWIHVPPFVAWNHSAGSPHPGSHKSKEMTIKAIAVLVWPQDSQALPPCFCLWFENCWCIHTERSVHKVSTWCQYWDQVSLNEGFIRNLVSYLPGVSMTLTQADTHQFQFLGS